MTMSLRTRLWCALLVILLSTQLHLCEAITLTIGSGYTSAIIYTNQDFAYATGVEIPAKAASTTDLSYKVVVKSATVEGYGRFVYSQFYSDASTIAVFGPTGHDFIDSYCKSKTAPHWNWEFMNFGAMGQVHYTDFCFFPEYRPNIMFIFPNEPAQNAGLASHLNQYDVFPRTQLVLHEDPELTGIGYASKQLLAQILPGMGVSNYKTALTTTLANYDDYIATKPGIIYLNARADFSNIFDDLVDNIIKDTRLAALNTTLGLNIEIAYYTVSRYYLLISAGKAALPLSNFAISSWIPAPDVKGYTFVQDYIANGIQIINPLSHITNCAGWLAGSALMQALTKYMGPTIGDRDVFFTNLVEAQSMFLVSDFFMGSFGPSPSPSAATCSDIQGQQGGVCDCHQGGNHIWLIHPRGKGGQSSTNKAPPYTYGKGMCSNVLSTDARLPPPVPYSQVLTMPGTVHLVGFSPFGDTMTSTVCSQVHNGLTRASDVTLYWHHSMNMVRGYCLSTTAQSLTTDLSTHQSTYVTTSLMGVIPDDLIAATPPPSTLILDFIPQTTQLRIAKTNYIYLFPTLEQELFVLANYLSNVAPAGSDVCAVVKKSKWSPAIALFLTNMMATFGITVAGSVVQPTGALSGTIPAGCKYTFVVGFEESDVAYLGTYLQSNAAATLLVSFDDVTKLYATFKSVFASASPTVTNRLIFATNLPTLTGPTSVPSVPLGKSAALSTVAEFVQTLPAVAQTPASVRAFIVSMVYDRLTTGTRWGLPDVQGALYDNETVRAGGMTFGPFYTLWMGSIYNFGARDIAVWSYTRVVTPSTPLLRDPVTPSFAYISAVSSSLSQQLMAARVGVAHDDVDEGSDCVQMQAESSAPTGQQTVGPKPSPTPAVEGNSGFHLSDEHSKLLTSSSSSPKLMFVARALIVLIILMVVYIAVLLLVLCGAVSCVTRHARLWKCCQSSNRGMRDDAAKVRARVNKESRHDQDLQQDARDPSRAPHHDATVPLTFVFVEVDLWRALWGSNGELTSRVVRHYQRCLRQAIVRHQCYEMKTMEGMCIVACPSAASGVEVAREIVDNVRGLARRDAEAVAALYAAMGAGACAVPGLRLRVAVNSGRAATSLDVLGRSQWRGSGVDDAVRAAYIGGRHGLVVVTANTKRALADVGSEPEGLESIGRCTKLADCVSSELFVLRVAPGEECSGGAMCELQNTAVDFPLYMLGVNGAERTRAVCHATSQLEAHYADVCEAERVADLVCMSQRFGLPDLRPGCYESQHELYGALLASVSEHLASMLECRHGVWRSARMNVGRGQWREKVPDFAPMPKRGQKAEGTVHGTQIHGEHQRHSHRRARGGFVPYRHFSYHTQDTEFREYPLDL